VVAALLWKPYLRFEGTILVIFGLLTLLLFLRGFRGWALYCAGVILLGLESGSLLNFPRYALVLFPAFFLLGEGMKRSRTFDFAYTLIATLGLGLLTARFVLFNWVS